VAVIFSESAVWENMCSEVKPETSLELKRRNRSGLDSDKADCLSGALLIREALPGERPALADLTESAYSQYAGAYEPAHWLDYQKSTRQILLHEEGCLRLIALHDGKLTGSVLWCPPYERMMGGTLVKNNFPEMRLLAVDPQFRNLGVGDQLIKACEARCKQEGFERMTLHTTVVMERAKAMYERRGYTRYTDIDFEPFAGFVVLGYWKEV
jgi:GNAT superfamily N-acetyltransferase